jgi:dCMP deaminase
MKPAVKELLALSYQVARTSPDTSNQNGAVLLDPAGHILSFGCNKFPPGVVITSGLLEHREKKLFYIEHAERNTLFAAARKGPTYNTTLICPWFACADCARAIVLMGVHKVIGHFERMQLTPERWKESVDAGLKLIKDAGVEVEFWSGSLNCSSVLVNGHLWAP